MFLFFPIYGRSRSVSKLIILNQKDSNCRLLHIHVMDKIHYCTIHKTKIHFLTHWVWGGGGGGMDDSHY